MINMAEVVQETERKDRKKSGFFGWLSFVLMLITVFLFFKYIIGITIISGDSMSPTLSNNDVIVTSNLYYTLDRNDIVVYKNNNGNHIIKRIIALPNETVEIKDGTIIVNGNPLSESYTIGKSEDMEKITVHEESFFLIGDNRNPGESLDSRSEQIGSIAKKNIIGKAIFSLFPLKGSFN